MTTGSTSSGGPEKLCATGDVHLHPAATDGAVVGCALALTRDSPPLSASTPPGSTCPQLPSNWLVAVRRAPWSIISRPTFSQCRRNGGSRSILSSTSSPCRRCPATGEPAGADGMSCPLAREHSIIRAQCFRMAGAGRTVPVVTARPAPRRDAGHPGDPARPGRPPVPGRSARAARRPHGVRPPDLLAQALVTVRECISKMHLVMYRSLDHCRKNRSSQAA